MKSRRKKESVSAEQWDRLLAVTSSRLEANKMAGVPPAGGPGRVFVREEPSQTDSEFAQILASIATSVTSSAPSTLGPMPAHPNGAFGFAAVDQQQPPVQQNGPLPVFSNHVPSYPTGMMKQEARPGLSSLAMGHTGSSVVGSKSEVPVQPLPNGYYVPPAPSRCCHPDVPDILLHILDHQSGPLLEHLRQYAPHQSNMCHRHLQKFVQKTLNFLLDKEAARAETTMPPISATVSAPTAPSFLGPNVVASVAVDEKPAAKRQRFDGDGCQSSYYECAVAGESQSHALRLDAAYDEAFRNQVMRELEEKLRQKKGNSHGNVTDRLILRLLQVCQSPDPGEALVLSGEEAAARVEAGPADCPIFTEGQQQFQWTPGCRPIEEIFRRMENLNRTVSVQIPSRKAHLQSFKKHKLIEVQQRFVESQNVDPEDPWNILDLRNPLPPTVMPKFLAGENCQLLSRVRDAVLSGGSGERTVAAKEKWNEWLDVMDWVLLSEGGHNTAPHMDSHGLATWITIQEGQFGFGWLSKPTKEERNAWISNPQGCAEGRWRFTVLTPGKTVFFNSGTIHFVFRVRHGQTLALGGHILQWSGIEQWVAIIRDQMSNPQITNEDVEWSAPRYLRVVSDLVINRVKNGRVDELGGQQAVDRFLDLAKELENDTKPPPKKKKR